MAVAPFPKGALMTLFLSFSKKNKVTKVWKMGKGIEFLAFKQVKREKKATVKWKFAICGQSAIDLAQGARGDDVFSIGCSMQPHVTLSGSRYIAKLYSLQQPSVSENGTCTCNRSMRRNTLIRDALLLLIHLYTSNMPTPICALGRESISSGYYRLTE